MQGGHYFFLLFSIGCSTEHANQTNFDVRDYGAVSGGHIDDSQAWSAACTSETENPTLIVPPRFLLNPIVFSDPCRAKNINFLILGRLLAPDSPGAWKGLDPSQWLAFNGVSGLNIAGPGRINGRGKAWWDQSCRDRPCLMGCSTLAPTALVSCKNSSISDDCVSIGDHTSNIVISYVKCSPGHGISIGSLGRSGKFVQVENIHVSKVYLQGTTNGARIKTWQVGRGYVQRVTFEHNIFGSVKNPVIIDQNYCNKSGACKEMETGVHITDVSFKQLYGTSSSRVAMNLNCSLLVACTRIYLKSICLRSALAWQNVTSTATMPPALPSE
ncbi:putative polygalacturonase [Prunus yedoensis var. nudiflora]|uniref:Putative polygalacturonase n=1 Tax=Prunus yedoensis var. nudiflora TaxID=2094558 RepID=A0A314ZQJ4_PRUYE|nr:putative polygalacturonase [Prunus yedoensis var. nudiflora]